MTYHPITKRDLGKPPKRWLDNRDLNRWDHLILESKKRRRVYKYRKTYMGIFLYKLGYSVKRLWQ